MTSHSFAKGCARCFPCTLTLKWLVKPETAEELAAVDDAALSVRVEQKMQSMLGRVSVEPGRQIYPLSALLPARFAKNRIALVGEETEDQIALGHDPFQPSFAHDHDGANLALAHHARGFLRRRRPR